MQPPSSNESTNRITEPVITTGSVRARRFRIVNTALEPWLYLLPALIIFTLFLAVPVAGTVLLSLTKWDGISWDGIEFIGLANYVEAAQDSTFWSSFWHNILLIPFFVIIPMVIGLIPAALVHQLKLRGAAFFQAGLFLPYIMPGVLIGVVWTWLLNPVFGPVNKILKQFGYRPPTWLGDFTWALPTVGMIGAWAAYGFCYVVFVAGMQKIPRDLYEAARLDGASAWNEFWSVTLPGLKREIAVVLSFNLINALRSFDVVRATTDGGPGGTTRVLALYMINAFDARRIGYSTAIAVILAVVTLILSMFVLRLFGEADD
ncbi:MAG: sugar ABC transporter permease [Thermomicrobiales bacterium]